MRKASLLLQSVIFLLVWSDAVNSQNTVTNFHNINLPENIMDKDKDGFIVIAHRGASAYYPENTMSAFRGAVEMGADMIELDVLLSKDGIPVVFHDAELDRKSDGKGLVSDYTLQELKQLDAGSWFDTRFKGEKIPTLEEVLSYTKDKIAVNIEIKTEAVSDNAENGIEQKVIDLVRNYEMTDKVIVSSFDYRVIERFASMAPEIRTALLYERRQSHGRTPTELVSHYHADGFNFSVQQMADNWTKALNQNNIPFFVYTVNDPELMKTVISKGAKGIFSDKPDVLKRVAEEVIIKKRQ